MPQCGNVQARHRRLEASALVCSKPEVVTCGRCSATCRAVWATNMYMSLLRRKKPSLLQWHEGPATCAAQNIRCAFTRVASLTLNPDSPQNRMPQPLRQARPRVAVASYPQCSHPQLLASTQLTFNEMVRDCSERSKFKEDRHEAAQHCYYVTIGSVCCCLDMFCSFILEELVERRTEDNKVARLSGAVQGQAS